MRQGPPLTARAQDIENGIDDFATCMISGTPAALDCRHEPVDELPFLIKSLG